MQERIENQIMKKIDSKNPSVELYDKNKQKLEGTYKKVISDKPLDEIYDRDTYF